MNFLRELNIKMEDYQILGEATYKFIMYKNVHHHDKVNMCTLKYKLNYSYWSGYFSKLTKITNSIYNFLDHNAQIDINLDIDETVNRN